MNRYVLIILAILYASCYVCLAGDLRIEHINTFDITCHAVALATIGDHRYVLADAFLINIDKPEKPEPKPGLMFGSQIEHIKVVGKYAYFAANVGGLRVLDISNPDELKFVVSGYHPIGNRNAAALCVDVVGKYAYVTFAGYGKSEDFGLHILDISDPAKPRPVGLYASKGTFSDVVVSNDRAYVTIIESGLHVVDVNDPSQPQLIGSCKLPSKAGGVAIIKNYCLVTAYDAGLAIVDLNDPLNPSLISTCKMPGHPRKVFVDDNRAYVAAQSGGMHIVDIENVSKPLLLASHPSKMLTLDVVVAGDYAFVANLVAGLEIVRIKESDK